MGRTGENRDARLNERVIPVIIEVVAALLMLLEIMIVRIAGSLILRLASRRLSSPVQACRP